MDQYDDRWEDWTRWVDGRYCCFSYILLSLPLVMLVREHREGVVEEKIFPASVCDCITFCLGVFRFVSPPITRRRYSPFNHSRFVKRTNFHGTMSELPTFHLTLLII